MGKSDNYTTNEKVSSEIRYIFALYRRWDYVNSTPLVIFRTWQKMDDFPIPRRYWKTLVYGLKQDFGDGVLQEIR